MNRPLKLLLIAGARPNFMKVGPVIRALLAKNTSQERSVSQLSYRLVHTGQHYDGKMSDIFFEELGIPKPDFNLEVGSGSHAAQTATIMTRFEPVLETEKPDWVVVVGDVNSTLACTLVAAKLGFKVAHVEAGLRSWDRKMPEEINRVATDALADLLLTPSADADENLLREGVARQKIRCVGNVMIDALVQNLDKARRSLLGRALNIEPRKFVYATLHRPANVDDRAALACIVGEIQRLSRVLPVVFPVHPRTRKMMSDFGLTDAAGGLRMIEPVGYHDSLFLTENARFVLTDSGGLQEESTYFRTPCLTLRPNTERPVTIQLGSNRLVSIPSLHSEIEQVLGGPERLGQVPPLWDGKTAERIIDNVSLASAG